MYAIWGYLHSCEVIFLFLVFLLVPIKRFFPSNISMYIYIYTKPHQEPGHAWSNYINPGYGLSLVDTLWNASSYRQPLEQEGNPMT